MGEDSILPLLSVPETLSYAQDSKILLVYQYTSPKRWQKVWNEIQTKFDSSCRLIEDKKCDLDSGDHEYAKTSTFCLEDVKKSCQEGMSLVVVGMQKKADEKDIDGLASVAYQTRYLLLFHPPPASVKKELAEKTNTISFGWFLNDTDSMKLREETFLVFMDCFEKISHFQKEFTESRDSVDRYQLDVGPKQQRLLYSVFISCDHEDNEAGIERRNEAVKKTYGKVDTLYISGFVITPNVIAARMRMTFEQYWQFFENAPSNDYGDYLKVGKGHKKEVTLSPEDTTFYKNVTGSSGWSKATLRDAKNVTFEQKNLSRGFGRKAHFIVGHAPRMNPFDIRMELTEVISSEFNAYLNGIGGVNWFGAGKADAKRMGKHWIVDLKQPLAVESIFASSCVKSYL